jgi:hypothetical protein
MAASGSKSLATIGFLTIYEQSERGLLGGYLVLNTAGRPLEFHCTAPVRASRAQEILYGPTLEPFLFGEQIGNTLVQKASSKPLFVCTDLRPALELREHYAGPVLFVAAERPSEDEEANCDIRRSTHRLDSTSPTAVPSNHFPLQEFPLGTNCVAVAAKYAADQEVVQRRWREATAELDLHEPFTRICEAIAEAHRGSARS